MEKYHYFIPFIFLLLISIKSSFSYIFPVKKIILTNNINKLNDRTSIQWNFECRGYGIYFNDKSNISLIPYNLFLDLDHYFSADEQIGISIKKNSDGTQEMVIDAYFDNDNFEITHFILENFGISIPFKYFYIKIQKGQEYKLRFKTKVDQEYIEFGKDLIDVMNIEFKDEKNVIIHNEEFLTKIEDNI